MTVLFADLAGYTALSRELDAEDVARAPEPLLRRVDSIVEEHGGRVDKHLGDCVMGVFGAPLAHGNEAERAVRAAIAIRDAMPSVSAEVGRSLGVHIGVAGGQVVASDIGSAGHRDYTVTGDSMNLASRLTDAARGGRIWFLTLSDVPRRAARRRGAGAAEVKGIAEPVRAWRCTGCGDWRPCAILVRAPSSTVFAQSSSTVARPGAAGRCASAARPGSARRP